MIRHTNSFLISLLLHTILLSLIIYSVKTVSFDTQKKDDEVVCLKLCNVKSQSKKEETTTKPSSAVLEKKATPTVKKELKKVEKTKEIKPVLTSKKPQVKIEKEVKLIKKKEDKKESPKVEIKSVAPSALPMTANKSTSSCNCKDKCTCDSKQDTRQMKNQRIQKEYMDENMKKIVKLLQENLYYPRSARKRGITGEVVVKFSLDTQGKVSFVKVTSSNSEILSRAAIKTIKDLSGDFPKPKERLIVKLPIIYNLN